MARLSAKNEARDYLQDAIYGSLFLGIGTVAANYYFDTSIDYGVPFAVAFGRAAFVRWMDAHRTTKHRQKIITGCQAHPGRRVLVNGEEIFLSTVRLALTKTIKYKPDPPARRGAFIWEVPYRDQVYPIAVRESRLFTYASQGWRRQLSGDPAPFGRDKFRQGGWMPQAEWCCYAVLASSGCFDTFGQGAKSRLVIVPARAVEACKRRYDPTTPLSQ